MSNKSKSATILTVATALVCTVAGVATALYALSLEATEKGALEKKANASSHHSSTAHSSSEANDMSAKSTGKVARAVIIYNNDGFMNPAYIVNAGDTVRVENKSSRELYIMTSDHHNHGASSPIDVGTMTPGDSSSFTAPVAGSYEFHNHHNQSEAAELIVQ